ncbi:MAG: hypothetical protein Q8M18_08310 [Bradyrhizobium sp.]|nr:hypothetical protein [Bradyrhizobium sp.]
MTRVTTIIALTCFLVVGAAAASILGRDGVPAAGLEITTASLSPHPVSNTAAKQDKLAVAGRFALASIGPSQDVTLSAPLRQAFASADPVDMVPPEIAAPQAAAPEAAPPPKPKVVAKPRPPVQKPYALLSDEQIAGIKQRLKLSSSQESYWPAVETALRGIARKIHVSRKSDPGALIDPDAEEVQQLKSAAMPLLFQLREDQKREVRTLARIIGLEKVASMI